jgi:hypothetical protein
MKFEKLTDDGRRTPSDSKSSHDHPPGELKIKPSHEIDKIEISLPQIVNTL